MSAPSFDTTAFDGPQAALDFIAGIVDSSTEYAIVATDEQGAVVLWSAGAQRLYGYSAAEAIGRRWTILHTPEDVDAGLCETVAAAVARDGRWSGVLERTRSDGSRFTARLVAMPRRDEGGAIVGHVAISRDVTQELRLSGELEGVQSFARSLIESAPDAMVIVDAAGAIQLANAETERLFGYSRDELVGRPVELLIPQRYADRHPEHRRRFAGTPRLRPMGAGLELAGRRSDGSEFPVEISLSPLETDGGLVVTAAVRDVTERKRFERDLREANAQLAAANRAKDRFLASMSHELRTPLNAIVGFTGTLLMELPGPLNDEQRKQLRTVQSNSRHLLSLINDLLDLARIESGKFELRPEPIVCQELLADVAGVLGPTAEQKGLALVADAPHVPISLVTDRRSLRQILLNLANNAIKFTDEGTVWLRVGRRRAGGGSAIRFDVVDTGCGIRAADQERLFAAFEQIGQPGGRPYEGTGLGLYICKTLARSIGATIAFESEFGHGSMFSLEVPE